MDVGNKLGYFYSWPTTIPVHKNDILGEEYEKWKNFSGEQRKLIIERIRKEKLEKMKIELKNTEIKEICKDYEQKKSHRKRFLELIKLLLLEIGKINNRNQPMIIK